MKRCLTLSRWVGAAAVCASCGVALPGRPSSTQRSHSRVASQSPAVAIASPSLPRNPVLAPYVPDPTLVRVADGLASRAPREWTFEDFRREVAMFVERAGARGRPFVLRHPSADLRASVAIYLGEAARADTPLDELPVLDNTIVVTRSGCIETDETVAVRFLLALSLRRDDVSNLFVRIASDTRVVGRARSVALTNLASRGDAHTAALARALLSDADVHTRSSAAWVLPLPPSPDDLPALLQLAREDDPVAQLSAARALRGSTGVASRQVLEQFSALRNRLGYTAIAALAERLDASAAQMDAWESSEDCDVREAAAVGRWRRDGEAGLDRTLAALRELARAHCGLSNLVSAVLSGRQAADVARFARVVLDAVPSAYVAVRVLAAHADRADRVRLRGYVRGSGNRCAAIVAADALSRLGDRASVPAFRRMARSNDGWEADAGRIALWRLSVPSESPTHSRVAAGLEVSRCVEAGTAY